MKYTKGEWRQIDCHNDSHSYDIKCKDKLLAIVLVYNNGEPTIDEYEAEANAKLISAAPNILKELQHIVERINTVRPDDSFCQALRDRANEAIKKAIE